MSRREALRAAAVVALGASRIARGQEAARRVLVGGHPWVYAATRPKNDITPALDEIFADMAYAGLDGIELMHTALRPNDAVDRIAALSERHHLPVLGTSFGGTM